MLKNDKIYLLKLGGSLLTDKDDPFSLREDVIDNTIDQIIKSNQKLILIHGGGSFGHPMAKEYQISKGFNPLIRDQLTGLSKTHKVMNELNSFIINRFIEKNFPAISVQPSTIFIQDSNTLLLKSVEPINSMLNLDILPILYGDILFTKDNSFSILSGDQIILELCKRFQKNIIKVIFAIEKDGVYIRKNDHTELATEIATSEIDNLKLAKLDEKIDVTGGIKGKLEIIKKISEMNIPVQLINGLKDSYILKALQNQKITSTNIKPDLTTPIQKEIFSRKIEHLKIPLRYNVQHSKNYFEDIKFVHHPLPEIDFNDIDLSTRFYNKSISAPICIAAITGGHPISKALNKILALAAESEKIIMSVGSQRIALENQSTIDSFEIVREVAPNIPIIGNIGIGQISDPDFKQSEFEKCVDMINADAMAIHFNALHELVQRNGDLSYHNFQENFLKIKKVAKIPLIAKEVGTGFDKDLALKLDLLGFNGFDVGGAGGTSFAAIEAFRDDSDYEVFTRKIADTFREWGIPTPISILHARAVTSKLLIATGGLKDGLDIAKSIILGADIGGFAYKFLVSAWEDYNNNTTINTIKEIRTLKHELKSCMWLLNLNNIESLKNNKDKIVLLGDLNQWAHQI
ncbi:MAG: type 2 isopentenyl-diphosphate Delta-isomerase [Candidatus Hermodarchaeota archaeon]